MGYNSSRLQETLLLRLLQGKDILLNTTAGTITVNLPAGAAGSIVSMADYAGQQRQTNNVILVASNGSELINADAGKTSDATFNSRRSIRYFCLYRFNARGWKSVTGTDADCNF